ncbi:MAG TPA: hypothetical protein VFC44_11300 [Candidatus Saccharimonadales bacterium]|nr:hypothetical protein [Candidatus Saccharimonadales bacterium]
MEIGLKGVGDGPSYLGWPYRVLSPKIERRAIPAVISFFVSALAGWWTYCIVKSSAAVSTPGLIVVFGLMAASIRLLIYCSGVAPPVNVWGRMTSGRILIPGFDKVFLTPLAVVLAGEMGGIAVRHSGSRYAAVESCVIALLGLVLLTGGPTLRNWTLTGQLRFRPTPSLQGRNQNQMLRRV